MPQIFVNPFNPQTPIGAGIQNLGTALFSGPTPDELLDKQVRAEMNKAHAELYRAQLKKAEQEAAEIAQRMGLSSEEGMDASVGASFGVSPDRVRAVRSIPSGPSPTGMPPAVDPMARQIGERLFALRSALATGKGGAHDIARADETFAGGRDREAVMAGADALPIARAHYATSGKAPFDFTRQGTGNLVTGDFAMNDLGVAEVGSEQAQGRQRDAAAGRERAHAGKYNIEAENLTRGLFGPQTYVDDGMGNTVPRFLGQVADSPTAVAAPRPVAPRATPPRVFSVPPSQLDDIDAEINAQLGVTMNKGKTVAGKPLVVGAQTKVRARAIEIFKETGNMASAVSQAISEIGELEDEMAPGRLWGQNATGRRQPRSPVIVNPGANQPFAAPAPTVQPGARGASFISPSGKQYTMQDIQFTAQKRGMTPDQVIMQLRLKPGA